MSKKSAIITFCVLGTAILVLLVLLIVTTTLNTGTILGLGAQNDTLEYNVQVLASQKESLEFQLIELESKLENAGEFYADEIEALKEEIENKRVEIAALEADIAKYSAVFSIDVLKQAKLIEQIEKYIKNECPYVKVKLPTTDLSTDSADSNADKSSEYEWVSVAKLVNEEITKRAALGHEVEPLFSEEELRLSGITETELTNLKLRELIFAREDVIMPSVSVYYEDLTTGYHYGFNESALYDAASVIKAPYVMSILRAVAADEKAYLAAKLEAGEAPERIDTDGDDIPDTTVIEYSDPIYNLSDIVIYEKKTMAAAGSGKIKNMPDGTELTYIDFVKYTLEESDNVGFSQLKKRFGYNSYYALAREVKANSVLSGGNNMSAADAGKLFKAIYEFIEEDNSYSQIMYNSMLKANHTVIIPYGVSPTKALHKYGWDEGAYHDVAIVLCEDKPYILSVFTDFEKGGDEVNEYLRNIVKMINKLHKGFYQN